MNPLDQIEIPKIQYYSWAAGAGKYEYKDIKIIKISKTHYPSTNVIFTAHGEYYYIDFQDIRPEHQSKHMLTRLIANPTLIQRIAKRMTNLRRHP